MRFAAWLVLALLAVQAKPSEFDVTHDELRGRRERLMERLKDGFIVLDTEPLKSGEAGVDYNTLLYDLKYLTHHHDDDGIVVLSPEDKKAWFFAKDVKTAAAKSGIKDTLPRAQFPAMAKQMFGKAKKVYTKVKGEAKKIIEASVPRGTDIAGGVAQAIQKMRLIKTELELKIMRKAADATNKAHLAAMKTLKPGMNEAVIAKTVEDTFRKEGCPEFSFPSICAAGKNGTILHYMANKEVIPANTTMVCDIGAGLQNYTTDITRTLPTNGKFLPEHRKAYQCVLDAQRAAENILKPGATFGTLHAAAAKVFEDQSLTDWSYAHSTSGGPRHGLSHWVGMSVHDTGGGEPFEPGMVITIEPGYYSTAGKFGIRIEDTYIITVEGFERIAAGAPREVDEIEKIMSGK